MVQWSLFACAWLLTMFFAYRPVHAQSMPQSAPGQEIFFPVVLITQAVQREYHAIPVQGPSIDRPPPVNGDINLNLRGYTPTHAQLSLVDVHGPTDANAPQLGSIFQPDRLPVFVAAHQVHDWDWGCGDLGCRADPITRPPVTLLEMSTKPGEELSIPGRSPDIYQGIYRAMVLYATKTQLTLVYTREDTPARGYVVHIEGIAVDPALLALYQELDRAGRARLPALRNDEPIGLAGGSIKVAIRDTGSFMDPRSRKDWWKDY